MSDYELSIAGLSIDSKDCTRSFLKPFMKEKSLNHVGVPIMAQGIYFC